MKKATILLGLFALILVTAVIFATPVNADGGRGTFTNLQLLYDDGFGAFVQGIDFPIYADADGSVLVTTLTTDSYGAATFFDEGPYAEPPIRYVRELDGSLVRLEFRAATTSLYGDVWLAIVDILWSDEPTPTPAPTPEPTPTPTPTPAPPTPTPGATVEVTEDTEVRVYNRSGVLTIYVDGINLGVEGFLQYNRSMVPLRVFSELLGIPVDWTGSLRRVTLHHPDGDVFIFIDSTRVEGSTRVLDSPPVLRGGTTFVPIRFVLELFGVNPDNLVFIRV